MELQRGESHLLETAVNEYGNDEQGIGVFSYEGFFLLPSPSISIIKEKLGSAKIIIFIRQQAHAINSLLNQCAKAHRVSFKKTEQFKKDALSYNPEFDYDAILSRWAAVFGDENVVPLLYDKRKDAVRQFCEEVDRSLLDEYIPTKKNLNPALSLSGYEKFLSEKSRVSDDSCLIELVNKLHSNSAAEMLDTRFVEAPSLFSEESRRLIMENYHLSNESVRKRWFPECPCLFNE